MSNFLAYAKPKDAKVPFVPVEMLDDYFGHHEYGVQFKNGEVLREDQCEFLREAEPIIKKEDQDLYRLIPGGIYLMRVDPSFPDIEVLYRDNKFIQEQFNITIFIVVGVAGSIEFLPNNDEFSGPGTWEEAKRYAKENFNLKEKI